MNARRLAAIAPLAMLAAALAARALIAHAPPFARDGLAQPLPVVTNWGGFGACLLLALAFAVAAGAYGYLRALAVPSSGAALGCLAGSAAALAAAWAWPAVFSSDAYAYAAYGELARIGANAYGHAALPLHDPVFAAAVWQWGNPPPACVYGPAFVALSAAALAIAAPLGVAMQLGALRLLATLALPLCGVLAYHAYGGDRRARTIAALTIAANPVAIWCAAEGHNDAIALAVALGGFALARRNAPLGAIVAALSGCIKAPGILGALPLGLRSRNARIAALLGAAVTLLVSLPLLLGAGAHVATAGRYAPQASLQAIFAAVPPLAAFVALAAAALLARAGIGRLREGDAEGWPLLALAIWVLVPNPYPWYGLWLLPVAAAAPGTRAAKVALALSLTALLRYVPDAIGAPSEPVAILLGIAASLPLAALLRKSEARVAMATRASAFD